MGDSAKAQADAHGCPGCPHLCAGPAVLGSSTVNIDGRPALRQDDVGIHAACCGPNSWSALVGSATVFINGKPAFRKGDTTRHCGGIGELIEGSSTVDIGGASSGGGGPAGASSGNAARTAPGGDSRNDFAYESFVGESSALGGAPSSVGTSASSRATRAQPTDSPNDSSIDEAEPLKTAHVIELEDAFFRTDSAVLLPEGQVPTATRDGRQHTPVGILATTLRYIEANPQKRVLVTGHTDTAGASSYNEALSAERAATAYAALTGERDAFASGCDQRHTVADYQQILTWLAATRGWDCDPEGIDGRHGPRTSAALVEFKRAYNRNGKAGNPAAPVIAEHGTADRATWAAFFDCYEETLRDELGASPDELTALRHKLRFLSPNPVGCGESHPIEAVGVDGYRSQLNRRVELLTFDPGEEPTLACHSGGSCRPASCDLYDAKKFRRIPQPVITTAKPWRATWDRDRVGMDLTAVLRLDAPGLADGTPVEFVVEQRDFGTIAKLSAPAVAGVAQATFAEWWRDGRATSQAALEPRGEFIRVTFDFVARAAGREARPPKPLEYSDSIEGELYDVNGNLRADTEYVVFSSWGTRRGASDAIGRVRELSLPTGGALIVAEGLAHFRGKLPERERPEPTPSRSSTQPVDVRLFDMARRPMPRARWRLNNGSRTEGVADAEGYAHFVEASDLASLDVEWWPEGASPNAVPLRTTIRLDLDALSHYERVRVWLDHLGYRSGDLSADFAAFEADNDLPITGDPSEPFASAALRQQHDGLEVPLQGDE